MKDIDNYISFANKAENFSDINEYLHCKELARRMKGLLDLYQQEKEKNKELLKEYNKKLNADWEDAISKDKIREKIESIDNALEVCEEEINYRLKTEEKAKIDVLKELLEEE